MEGHFEDDFFIPPGFPAFPNYPYYSEGDVIVISNSSTKPNVENWPENLKEGNESAENI